MLEKLLRIGHARRYILGGFDIVCFIFADVFVYLLLKSFDRYDGYLLSVYVLNSALIFVLMCIFRLITGVYNYVWRYPSTFAYFKIMVSDGISGVLALVLSLLFGTFRSVWHFSDVTLMTTTIAVLSRLTYRLMYKYYNHSLSENKPHINVAIVGAGQLGALLANDLLCNKKQIYVPMFFIDSSPAKIGSRVSGLTVYKNDSRVMKLIKENNISEIIIAINELDSERADYLYHYYEKTGCKIKLYETPISQSDNSSGSAQRIIREFQIEDLLFRRPLKINDSKSFRYYAGKTVLVTGGGGSIGSEICRQIAMCNPKKLVIFDIYENNAYDIQQELKRTHGDFLDLAVEIGSVRDRERLDGIFEKYRPDIIFHAAAHKHVPLMETSACEAIKNNVFGTYNAADAAEKYGAEKFILISTDKAVNPTNVMGASKRLCEFVVQCRYDSNTKFAAVRFGNVLGSNGSVIPLFKRQIANGGPITITDKRIIRYFMTIPEASQLVIQAGAMAEMGELFVLDMGKPVKIYDLALNMIRFSGFEPEKDIKIEEIGLRPGEKLYEELLMKSETLDKTDNDLIFIEKDTPLSRGEVDSIIGKLKNSMCNSSIDDMVAQIKKVIIETVPTYHTPEEVNINAEESAEMKDSLNLV